MDDNAHKLASSPVFHTDNGEVTTTDTILEQMGGWQGIIASTLPVIVFVPVNAWVDLTTALIASILVALGVLVFRLVRKERLAPAIGGFIAVALCGAIAYRMGNAKGYYIWGIWVSCVYGVLCLLTILCRVPLVGVVWSALQGTGYKWRYQQHPRRLYAYATAIWMCVFLLRFGVQQGLYYYGSANELGVARIVMGWPLTLLALIPTVWLVRRAMSAYRSVEPAEASESERSNG